jgi:hypothetical protein
LRDAEYPANIPEKQVAIHSHETGKGLMAICNNCKLSKIHSFFELAHKTVKMFGRHHYHFACSGNTDRQQSKTGDYMTLIFSPMPGGNPAFTPAALTSRHFANKRQINLAAITDARPLLREIID